MRFVGVEEAIGELRGALESSIVAGVNDVDAVVADEAARHHTYTNRTWNLQRHTQPGRVSGSVSSGRVRGEVVGDMFYGSFVDEGTSRSRPYPFLLPAFVRSEYAVVASLDRSIYLGIESASGNWRAEAA